MAIDFSKLLLGLVGEDDTVTTIDFSDDFFDLLVDRKFILIKVLEILWLVEYFKYFLGEVFTTFAAFFPYFRQGNPYVLIFAPVEDEIPLLISIGYEVVECNNRFDAEFACIFDGVSQGLRCLLSVHPRLLHRDPSWLRRHSS